MLCGRLEVEILNSFWKLSDNGDKDISIQDVVDDMTSCGINRAYTTIKTVMDRLTAKSVLVRYKSGKKFFYKAAITKEEMALDAIQTVSAHFFNGNYIDMIKFIEKSSKEILV